MERIDTNHVSEASLLVLSMLPISRSLTIIPERFRVVIVCNPFKLECEERLHECGMSISDILHAHRLSADVPASIYCGAMKIIDRSYKPHVNTLVTIRVLLAGGGSNGLLLQVGLMIAGAALAPLTGGMSMMAGAMLGGMIGSLLNGIMSLVMGPSAPKSKLSGAPQLYTISGDSNALAPYAPIALTLGKRRVTPTYYGQSYNEPIVNEQYVRILASSGYGPIDISNIKIKDTDINTFYDVQIEQRAGYPDDPPVTIFQKIVDDQTLSVILLDSSVNNNTVGTGWFQRTTAENAETIGIDVQFPSGLMTVNDVGNRRWLQVSVEIRYAPTGTGNWINRPVLNSRGSNQRMLMNSDQWEVAKGQYDVSVRVNGVVCASGGGLASPGNVISADTNWIALRSFRSGNPIIIKNQAVIALRIRASGQLNGEISNLTFVAQSIRPTWNGTSWYSRAGSWDYDYETNDGVHSYDLDATNPHTANGRALHIQLANESSAFVASKSFPVRWPHPAFSPSYPAFAGEAYKASLWYRVNGGIGAGITVKIYLGAHENFEITDALSVSFVVANNIAATTNWQQVILDNIKIPDFATTSPDYAKWARIVIGCVNNSGAQKDVYFDDVLVERVDDASIPLVNVIPNPSFDYPGERTSNPAAHFRSILLDDREVGTPLDKSRLDLLSLEDWYVKADTKQNYFNGILDQEKTSINDALTLICSAGRAALRTTDGYYGVVLEEDGKIAKQQFTDLNMHSYKWEVGFIDRPNMVRARFANAQNNYATDEIIVYDDGYSVNGPVVIDNEVVTTGSGASQVAIGKLKQPPIGKGTLTITTTTAAGDSTITDDGNGGFTGTYLSSGTIDYASGDVQITYTANINNNAEVIATYNGQDSTVPGKTVETLDFSPSTISAAQAWRQARFHMAVVRQRAIIYSWVSDLEHIVSQRGDVVYLQSYIGKLGGGSARIKTLTSGNTGIASIIVDEYFTLKAHRQHAVRIRLDDGGFIHSNIVQVNEDTITNTLTFSDELVDIHPKVGDLLSFDDPKLVLITVKDSGDDYNTAQFKAVEYSPPGLYTAEDRGFDWVSKLGLTFALPIPILLSIKSDDTVLVTNPDGSKSIAIVIELKKESLPLDSFVRVTYHESGMDFSGIDRGTWNVDSSYIIGDIVHWPNYVTKWERITITAGIQLPGVSLDWVNLANFHPTEEMQPQIANAPIRVTKLINTGTHYDIHIRYERPNGDFSQWLDIFDYTIIGQVTIPKPPTDLTAAPYNIGTIQLSWTAPVGQTNVKQYEVRLGSTWNSASVIAQTASTHIYITKPAVGAYTYWVATIDTSDNYSIPISDTFSIDKSGVLRDGLDPGSVTTPGYSSFNGIVLNTNGWTLATYIIQTIENVDHIVLFSAALTWGGSYSGTDRGTWDIATAYVTGDIVHFNGTWQALQNGTGHVPGFNPTYWSLVGGGSVSFAWRIREYDAGVYYVIASGTGISTNVDGSANISVNAKSNGAAGAGSRAFRLELQIDSPTKTVSGSFNMVEVAR